MSGKTFGLASPLCKCRIYIPSSCRRRGNQWFVAMNKWQDITDMEVSQGMAFFIRSFRWLMSIRIYEHAFRILQVVSTAIFVIDIVQPKTEYSEFLIHAADVEGLCQGIDEDLVSRQSLCRFPCGLTF